MVLPNGKIAIGDERKWHLLRNRYLRPDVTLLLEYPDDFRCTCTDPSHDD